MSRKNRLQMQKQNQKAIKQTSRNQDYSQGYSDGWNAVVSHVENTYEPLINHTMEAEVLVNLVRGMVIRDPQKLPPTALIKEYAIRLGDALNRADVANKAMTMPFGSEDGFFQLSIYHEWRDAMLRYANGKERNGETLIKLAKQNEHLQRHVSLNEALKKRETQGMEITTLEIGRGIHQRRKQAKANGKRLTLNDAARQTLDELGYQMDIPSAVSYFYRVKNAGLLEPSKS